MQKKKSQLLTIAASLCLPLAIAAGSAHAGPPPSAQPKPNRNVNVAIPANALQPPHQDRSFVQTEGEMTAKTRLFGPIGPGLRAVRRSADGRTYILEIGRAHV